MQREQGRDLFDLFHTWTLSEAGATPYAVDGARSIDLVSGAEGTRTSAGEAYAALDAKLRKEGFRRDMDTLLRPGLPAHDVDRSAEIVRAAYFRHLGD